ncbi:hypothetical protein [Paenibacillus piri]|uniref:hypothetical protein n=1 Tax=Paenibacillus piri TaxID=2547395 RepID=UPI001404D018|nr:hypothetical protein [Paenibacillus piri]
MSTCRMKRESGGSLKSLCQAGHEASNGRETADSADRVCLGVRNVTARVGAD